MNGISRLDSVALRFLIPLWRTFRLAARPRRAAQVSPAPACTRSSDKCGGMIGHLRRSAAGAFALMLAAMPAARAVSAAEAPAPRVLFINVGKADAALVMADGWNCLIDTGSKASVPRLFGALTRMGVSRLDAVFLTHTHKDHTGGMEALAKYRGVDKVYSAGLSIPDKNGRNIIAKMALEIGVSHMLLSAGDTVAAGGCVLEVLGPVQYDGENDNNNSLVLRLRAGGQTLLFAGDMEYRQEYTLLEAGTDLKADVLKVGNHGNSDATSRTFAAAVAPDIAVISTDTLEDVDSASQAVFAALGSASVYVTEDYETGVLLGMTPDGASIIALETLEPPASLRILGIDPSAQTAVIANAGGALDVSGYMLCSEKGNEVLVFPEGTILTAGGTLTVACEGRPGDLIWTGEKKVWNTKEPDTGVLYDRWGRELARHP